MFAQSYEQGTRAHLDFDLAHVGSWEKDKV